jgi:hypothetical protein
MSLRELIALVRMMGLRRKPKTIAERCFGVASRAAACTCVLGLRIETLSGVVAAIFITALGVIVLKWLEKKVSGD